MTNKALFLDRDGIINIDHGYVHKSDNFDFTNGIFDVCRHAIERGYIIIVITNQAGIARGYYSIADFERLTRWMKEKFKQQQIDIKDVYFCPHHPESGVNEFVQACDCRKPKPGMILKAQSDHKINLNESVFIGDKISDIEAASAAGVKTKILLASQYINATELSAKDTVNKAHQIQNISGAIEFIN